IVECEAGARFAPDQKEGVAGHRLGKADEVAVVAAVIGLHDPHWSAPSDIDRTGEQAVDRPRRLGRADELDLHPFAAVGTKRQRRVERGVEHAAQVFLKRDCHPDYPATRRIRSAASANTWAPSTISSSLVSSDQ